MKVLVLVHPGESDAEAISRTELELGCRFVEGDEVVRIHFLATPESTGPTPEAAPQVIPDRTPEPAEKPKRNCGTLGHWMMG